MIYDAHRLNDAIRKPGFTRSGRSMVMYGVLGLACVAGAFGMIFFVKQWLLVLPSNYHHSSEVVSTDNFYDVQKKMYHGEQESITTFTYDVVSKNGPNLVIRNLFDVHTYAGDRIFSVERLYGIDSRTKEHVSSLGDHPRKGYLFAPRMKGSAAQQLDKASFMYWHVNYDTVAVMQYQASESLYGLDVYRYEANFKADQTKELTGSIPEVGVRLGIALDTKLQLWIEPYTGEIIQYTDSSEAFFYDLTTGERTHPWNKFSNATTQRSASLHATEVNITKQKIILLGSVIPIFLVILGVFCFVIAFIHTGVSQKLLSRIPRAVVPFIMPVTVGAFVFGISITGANVLGTVMFQLNDAQVVRDVEQTNAAIVRRLGIYNALIKAGESYIYASENVTRDEWLEFANHLNVQQEYPGIQAFGFARVIPSVGKQSFERQMAEQGFPDFQIFPQREQPEYLVTEHIAPFDSRNMRFFGYDFLSDPQKKEALLFARNTGEAVLSGKVAFNQEDASDQRSEGFLLLRTVYLRGLDASSARTSDDVVLGYVFGFFRGEEFANGVLHDVDATLYLEIYDTADPKGLTRDHLLYSNVPSGILTGSITKISSLRFGGHVWTIKYVISKSQASILRGRVGSSIVLLVGGIISISLASVLYILNTRKEAAVQYANMVTKDLVAAQKIGKFGSYSWNIKTGISQWSDEAFAVHGLQPSENHAPPPVEEYLALLHEEDRKFMQERIQMLTSGSPEGEYTYRLIRKGQDLRWIKVTAQVVRDGEGKPEAIEGTFQDITDEKVAAASLAAKNAELERFNNIMIDRELKMIEMKEQLKKYEGKVAQ